MLLIDIWLARWIYLVYQIYKGSICFRRCSIHLLQGVLWAKMRKVLNKCQEGFESRLVVGKVWISGGTQVARGKWPQKIKVYPYDVHIFYFYFYHVNSPSQSWIVLVQTTFKNRILALDLLWSYRNNKSVNVVHFPRTMVGSSKLLKIVDQF